MPISKDLYSISRNIKILSVIEGGQRRGSRKLYFKYSTSTKHLNISISKALKHTGRCFTKKERSGTVDLVVASPCPSLLWVFWRGALKVFCLFCPPPFFFPPSFLNSMEFNVDRSPALERCNVLQEYTQEWLAREQLCWKGTGDLGGHQAKGESEACSGKSGQQHPELH